MAGNNAQRPEGSPIHVTNDAGCPLGIIPIKAVLRRWEGDGVTLLHSVAGSDAMWVHTRSVLRGGGFEFERKVLTRLEKDH